MIVRIFTKVNKIFYFLFLPVYGTKHDLRIQQKLLMNLIKLYMKNNCSFEK